MIFLLPDSCLGIILVPMSQ